MSMPLVHLMSGWLSSVLQRVIETMDDADAVWEPFFGDENPGPCAHSAGGCEPMAGAR